MKSSELQRLHNVFLSGASKDGIDFELSEMAKEEQAVFIDRVWDLFKQNQKDLIEHRDWSEAQVELLLLVLEQKGEERITDIFNQLAEILHKSASSVQFKYYKTLKKIEEGLSLKEIVSITRGRRGKNKKTLIREGILNGDLPPQEDTKKPNLYEDIEANLTPELKEYINSKATELAKKYINISNNKKTPEVKMFFEAHNGIVEEFANEKNHEVILSRNIKKIQKAIQQLEGKTETEKEELLKDMSFLLS